MGVLVGRWREMTVMNKWKKTIRGKVEKTICRVFGVGRWREMTVLNKWKKTIREKVEKTICRSASADAYSRLKTAVLSHF